MREVAIEQSWVCWSKVTKSGKETSLFFVCVGVFCTCTSTVT